MPGKGVLDRAQHPTAAGLDHRRRLRRKRGTECVVGLDDEPGVATVLQQRPRRRPGERVGVVRPLDVVGRASLARQLRRAGVEHRHLVVVARHGCHGEGAVGHGDIEDRIDPALVEPGPREGGGHVRLGLRVAGDHLDGDGAGLFTREILDRQLRGDDRAGAAVLGIGADISVSTPSLTEVAARAARSGSARAAPPAMAARRLTAWSPVDRRRMAGERCHGDLHEREERQARQDRVHLVVSWRRRTWSSSRTRPRSATDGSPYAASLQVLAYAFSASLMASNSAAEQVGGWDDVHPDVKQHRP